MKQFFLNNRSILFPDHFLFMILIMISYKIVFRKILSCTVFKYKIGKFINPHAMIIPIKSGMKMID